MTTGKCTRGDGKLNIDFIPQLPCKDCVYFVTLQTLVYMVLYKVQYYSLQFSYGKNCK